MDLNIILQAIATVGFPIVGCIYLVFIMQKNEERHAEETEKREKRHLEEIEKLRETVENNTKVMIKICAKMGVDIDD